MVGKIRVRRGADGEGPVDSSRLKAVQRRTRRLVLVGVLTLVASLAGEAAFADGGVADARLDAQTQAQVSADRLAIEQVWARYAQALDTADPEAYASLFTSDAYLEVDGKAYRGGGEIKGLIRDIRKKLNVDAVQPDSHGRRFGPIRHLLSGLIVDVKGDRATSESYWTEIIANGRNAQGVGNPPSVLKMGRYEDELVKRNGRWLFSRRIITGDLQMPRPNLD